MVNISSKDGYETQSKKTGEEYSKYIQNLTISENTQVTARYKKGNDLGREATKDIKKYR